MALVAKFNKGGAHAVAASAIQASVEAKRGQIMPTQCQVIFLNQEGLMLQPRGADTPLIVIAQSQKGSDSLVAGAKGAEQILICGAGGTLFL